MDNSISFSDFKLMVKEELTELSIQKNSALHIALNNCIIVPHTMREIVRGTSVPNLNTSLFDDFLETNYKDRFEECKNDIVALDKLSREAANQYKELDNG